MPEKSELMEAMRQVLDHRLGDMTDVVTEAQRSASSAAGAAMKVTGQMDEMRRNVSEGFHRIELTQAEHGARQAQQQSMIKALSITCSERRTNCEGKFKATSDDLHRAWQAAEADYRRELKLAHARISKVERTAKNERVELSRKLSDVREDTGVRHMQDIEREALERGKLTERQELLRKLGIVGKWTLKVVVALAVAGGGSVGIVELLKLLLGG